MIDLNVQTPEGFGGTTQITEDAVAAIAGAAATECDGVLFMAGGVTGSIAETFGVKNASKGVKITAEAGNVYIDLTIFVKFGQKIHKVAEEVQQKVKSTIESMTGLNVAAVNVRVAGVANVKEKKVRPVKE
ncbi:MAG: Asp23/Gls24 family envelope stress response protein [Clostridiales bacterium]|jgi:uncharacterized alkaline shock family protein YloU|nr:Asp23/Gls24 family envelope stress response protein [Clostridiales bacterium]